MKPMATKKVVRTTRCPGCGRPFATEITTAGVRHQVICQSGHTWNIVALNRRPKDTEYELEEKAA